MARGAAPVYLEFMINRLKWVISQKFFIFFWNKTPNTVVNNIVLYPFGTGSTKLERSNRYFTQWTNGSKNINPQLAYLQFGIQS